MKKPYSLFLSPRGRIGRGEFIIGVLALIIFATLQKFIFPYLGDGLSSFFIPMAFFFLTLHFVLCIYGKRLRDIGRSLWPLMGLLALMMVAAILISLNFGGIEYIDTVISHPEYAGNEDAMKRVQDTYQNTLATNMPYVRPLMAILPILFTLWLAISSNKTEDVS